MHRCGSGFLLTLAIAFVVALTGCLGKSSSNSGNGGVQSVTLSPAANISIDVGGTQVFSATGKNANGGAVLGVDIQYVVGVPPGTTTAPPLSIANNGNAAPALGTPASPFAVPELPESPSSPPSSMASAARSLLSTFTSTSIAFRLRTARPNRLSMTAFRRVKPGQYAGIAYSNSGDITSSVGPMTWSSSNTGVVTTTPIVSGHPENPVYLVQTTAKSPGITQLFASVSGVSSNPYPYTTCLIQAIWLQIGGQNQAGNSITVNNGGSIPVTAIAIDTLCQSPMYPPASRAPHLEHDQS
jgi:hypothetical protein